MRRFAKCEAVALLACFLAVTSGQPGSKIGKIIIPGPFSFSIIGDWGRLNGVRSVLAPPKGLDYDGQCAARNFTADLDVAGAVGQVSIAASLDVKSRQYLSAFIISTGDNFYECGAETSERIVTDWLNIYTGRYIRRRAWFQTIGNHDIPRNSVPIQLNYTKENPRWILPSRYYAVDYVNTSPGRRNITMRIAYINTNPFITSYSKKSNKYYGPEILATATPAAISEQLEWLNATLQSFHGDFTIVVGHHPMASASDTVFGPFQNYINNQSGVSVDAGMPDKNGVPSWTRLRDILNQNKVQAYFNGHDHVLAHTVDPVNATRWRTQYITTGAGSSAEVSGACGINARPWVKWVGVTYSNSSCVNPVGQPWVGYNVVHVNTGSAGPVLSIEFFALKNYNISSAERVYTIRIPSNLAS